MWWPWRFHGWTVTALSVKEAAPLWFQLIARGRWLSNKAATLLWFWLWTDRYVLPRLVFVQIDDFQSNDLQIVQSQLFQGIMASSSILSEKSGRRFLIFPSDQIKTIRFLLWNGSEVSNLTREDLHSVVLWILWNETKRWYNYPCNIMAMW